MINAVENQYLGFLNTPTLWNDSTVFNLEQFSTPTHTKYTKPTGKLNKRLGKRVEQFFSYQLRQHSQYEILHENLQIKSQQNTIGELDVLVKDKNTPIHIELIYKFYLYDTTTEYRNQLDNWIGPNRKDTLVYKINKLKKKQLPLLYHSETKKALEKLNYFAEDFRQYVCFKAQLFLPFNNSDLNIEPLNRDCVAGFFINHKELDVLNDYSVYIPEKCNWLIQPHNNAQWKSLYDIKPELNTHINEKWSPLVWLKLNNYIFKKCFVTWW